MCMCVYIYIYVCIDMIYIYIYMCVCVLFTYIHTCMHACMHTYVTWPRETESVQISWHQGYSCKFARSQDELRPSYISKSKANRSPDRPKKEKETQAEN